MRYLITLICLLAIAIPAQANVCTSKGTGNWTTFSTWSSCTRVPGVPRVPGAGDRAIISAAHVVTIQAGETITVGEDGPTGTPAVTFTGTGAGKLDVYGNLVLRGDLLLSGSTTGAYIRSVELRPGSSLVFDPSTTGIRYGMYGGNLNIVDFLFSGTGWGSTEMVRVYTDKTRGGASALNGFLGDMAGGAYLNARWNINYTRMDNIGDAAKTALAYWGNNANNTFRVRNLLMNSCGAFSTILRGINASCLDVDGLDIRNPILPASKVILDFGATIAATTPRQYKNITIYNNNTSNALIKFQDGDNFEVNNLTLYNTHFYVYTISLTATSNIIYNKLFFLSDIKDLNQHGPWTLGKVTNSVFYWNFANKMHAGVSKVFDGNILGNEVPAGYDILQSYTESGGFVLGLNNSIFRNNLFLPNAPQVDTGGTGAVNQEIYNNTFIGTSLPNYNIMGIANGTTSGAIKADNLLTLKNNLFYKIAAGMVMPFGPYFTPFTVLTSDYNATLGNAHTSDLSYSAGSLTGQRSFWGAVATGQTQWFADGRAIGSAGAGANDLIVDPQFRAIAENVPVTGTMIRDYVGGATYQDMAKIVITVNGWDYQGNRVTPTTKTVDDVSARMKYLFTPTNPTLTTNIPAPTGGSEWIGALDAAVDTTAPTISSFTVDTPAADHLSVTAHIVSSDEIGGTGVAYYALTETTDTPTSWTATNSAVINASYPFAAYGAKTLYAWVKDAAGNPSAAAGPVTFTLTQSAPTGDTTPPTITTFTVPASVTIPIPGPVPVTLAATDAGNISQYLLSTTLTSADVVTPLTAGWVSVSPTTELTLNTTIPVNTPGPKTITCCVMDAATNITCTRALTTVTQLATNYDTAAVVTAVLDTPLSEDYAAPKTLPTLRQLMFMIWATLSEKSVNATTGTMTVNKLDGVTPAMKFSLGNPKAPNSLTRTQ